MNAQPAWNLEEDLLDLDPAESAAALPTQPSAAPIDRGVVAHPVGEEVVPPLWPRSPAGIVPVTRTIPSGDGPSDGSSVTGATGSTDPVTNTTSSIPSAPMTSAVPSGSTASPAVQAGQPSPAGATDPRLGHGAVSPAVAAPAPVVPSASAGHPGVAVGAPPAAQPAPLASPALTLLTAESHRRAGRLPEAIALLEPLAAAGDNPDVLWRMAYCLRRSGRAEDALVLAAQAHQSFPQHELVASEFAWAIHAVGLKPALEARDWPSVLTFAGEMPIDRAGEVAARVAFFAAVGAARALNRWDLVKAWCDRLPPDRFSEKGKTVKGRPIPSDRERWYLVAVRAHLALQDWPEARRLALEAAGRFPRRPDFPRWAAQALAGAGDLAGARAELLALTATGRMPWYVWADLADVAFRQGEPVAAWEAARQAARGQGEPAAKVNLFFLMATLAERLDRPADAALHLELAVALRRERGWALPEPLQEAAVRWQVTGGATVADLLRRCRESWGLAVSGSAPQGGATAGARGDSVAEPDQAGGAASAPRQTGRLVHYNEARDIAFIQPDQGGDAVFAYARDLPEECRFPRARVSYTLIPGFDRKKNRPARRAADIRAAS